MFRRRIEAYSDPADLPRHLSKRWMAVTAAFVLVMAAWTIFGVIDTPIVIAPNAFVRTVVVIVGGATLALGALYSFWRYRIERLARTPGPLQVVPVVDRTGAPTDSALARKLTGEFQRCLAATRLYKSTAIPSSGTSSEFLDVVERAGDSFAGFWTPVMRLLRLLSPLSAYQVRCELLPPRAGRKVIQVELHRVPASALAPAIIEEQSWERAIEHAAHRVAAAILPRTRQCRTPPWTMWQDLRMPRPLFDLVQRFHTERAERRFDEALATLREAIRLDPSNLALRLELGKLQETMDMHLDALLTYDDIVGRASRSSAELSAYWNRAPGYEPWHDEGRAPSLPASHPVVHVARYRHALLLALGDKLAAQWWDRPLGCPEGLHRGAREQRRDYLRRILAERLSARYEDVASSLARDGLTRMPTSRFLSQRRPPESDNERRAAQREARIFFTSVAVAELERLVSERATGRVLGRPPRGQREVLPQRSLELALFSAGLRRGMALAHAGRNDRAGYPGVYYMFRSVVSPHRWLHVVGERRAWSWPPPVEAVEGAVEEIVHSRTGTLRSWLEHYNAACVYALLLFSNADPFTAAEQTEHSAADRARRREAARRAVDELAKAVQCSDSGYLASQRDWLLIEDPDLDQLRSFRAFRDFEARTFGSVGRAYQRGPRMGIWQQTAHVADIIASSGAQMAQLWERRLDAIKAGPIKHAALQRWLDEEREGWRLAEVLAVDHRDWGTRHRVCRQIDTWADTAGIDLSRRPHPAYSEARLSRQLASMDGDDVVRPIDADAQQPDTIARNLIRAMRTADERLADLARALRLFAGSPDRCCDRALPLVLADEWNDLEQRLAEDAEDPDVALLISWAEGSRLRWQALSAWFDDSVPARGTLLERRSRFEQSLMAVTAAASP